MDSISLDLPVAPGVDLLQRANLFRKLGYEETLKLAALTKLERKQAGEVIVHQDALGQALYVLREGSARVRRKDPITGEERELATLHPGDLFGEMSLIEDQLTSADVVAVGSVELVVIGRQEFEELMSKDDRLALKVYRAFCASLSDKLRKANQRLADTTGKVT